MISLLNQWKSRLLLVGAGVISALLLYISTLKKKALKKEIEQLEELSEAKDKVNEAVKEGLENEAKPISRGYFNDPGSR